MHHGRRGEAFVAAGLGDVVGRRGDGAGLRARDQHGDEGLFEVVTRFLAGDELRAPSLDLGPVERFAAQAAQSDIDERGNGSAGEAFHQRAGVAVAFLAIDGMQRPVRRGQPVEQESGASEKQEVGVDDELPARGPEMRVREFADVRIVAPPLAQHGKLGLGQQGLEPLANGGSRPKATSSILNFERLMPMTALILRSCFLPSSFLNCS